jgi:hypothetical protein
MAEDDCELITVRTFLNRIEAEVAQSALEAADIESMIAADDAGGTRPGPWVSGVRLIVRVEDRQRANEILDPPTAAR